MWRLFKKYSIPEELDQVNREFFIFASEQGLAYEKITCGGSYRHIRDEMIDRVNEEEWSGKVISLEEVIEMTNRIVIGGVNGFFREGDPIPL